MRCPACNADLPPDARFCPGCGAGAQAPVPPAEPLTVEGGQRGDWRWTLSLLLLLERAVALWAFPLDDPRRALAPWEGPFLQAWGWGGLLGLLALGIRHRSGGWLAGLSGLALLVRSAVPLASEKPADGAVWALMAASATLTFAFFHEQSWWGRGTGD